MIVGSRCRWIRRVAAGVCVALALFAFGVWDTHVASASPSTAAEPSGYFKAGDPADKPITLAIVAELSGKFSSIGGPWKVGVEWAAKEINQDGGILGHPLEVFTADTQSSAAVSAAAVRYALGKNPLAIIGPVLSSSIAVDVKLTRRTKVPQFVGGIADAFTQQGNPWVFRTNPSSSQESVVNAKFLADNMKAKKVAIVYRDDARGQSAKAALSKDLNAYGVSSVAIAVSPTQSNYAGLAARIGRAGVDTIYLSAIDTQDAQIITALKAAGVTLPVTGDTEALSSTVSTLTGGASDGVRGVVDFSPSAPRLKDLAAAYTKAYGEAPTAQFYKAYIATWQIKYALDRAGRISRSALADALHDQVYCVSKYPHLLLSTYWASNGDPYRDQFEAVVRHRHQDVTDIVKSAKRSKLAVCGGG